MKKSALRKDTFREIGHSFSRFLSILLIICLGVGFFVGVKATAPSMRTTAEEYFNDYKLFDFELLSMVGFGEEDVEAIKQIDGIKDVMPSYSADLLLTIDGMDTVVNLSSIPTDVGGGGVLNNVEIVEGRLPQADNEIAMCEEDLNGHEFKIGDVLTFKDMAGTTETAAILSNTEFTVVGLIDSPKYISYSYGTSALGDGSVYSYGLVTPSVFVYERYTEMYVTLDCHDQGISALDEGYVTLRNNIAEWIDIAGSRQVENFVNDSELELSDAENEYSTSKNDAQQQLDEGKSQLDDALKQLEDSKNQLADAEKEISSGRQELEEARKQLADAQAQIASGKQEITSGWNEYYAEKASGEQQIKEAEAQIASYEKQLADGKAQLAASKADAQAQLAAGRKELDDGWAQYDAGYAEYAAGVKEYNAGKVKYDEAYQQYQDGLNQYNQAQQQYNTNSQLVQDYSQYISQAQSLLDQLNSSGGADPSQITQLSDMITSYQAEMESAQQQLTEAETALPAAKEELDAAQAELTTAETELNEAKAKVDSAAAELAESKKLLEQGEADYKTQKASAEAEIAAAEKEIADGEAELAQAKKDLANSKAYMQTELANGLKELQDAEKEISSAESQYSSGLKDYQSGLKELEAGENEYKQGLLEYEEGRKEYDDGYNEYLSQLAKANSEFSDYEAMIANARARIDELNFSSWYVFTRDDIMVNYSSFDQDAQRIDAIASIFPVFFLLVAALVCLTTMSRMVDEQRTAIGTYKALGYSSSQIAGKYVRYAAIAGIIGSIIGSIVCILILPKTIFSAYSQLYYLPSLKISTPWLMIIIAFVVALACTVLVAYLSCRKSLREVPAQLMRPKSPKSGKKILLERIPGLWKLFSFSSKITARNLFRYKIRLTMTIVGIAGCAALVVAAFGLQDAISPIVDKQFGEISDYDLMLTVNPMNAEDSVDFLAAVEADTEFEAYSFDRYSSIGVENIEGTDGLPEVYLVVPESPENLSDIVTFKEAGTGKIVSMDDGGVILTEKAANIIGAQKGSTINLIYNNKQYPVTVSAVMENYCEHYVYMTPALYETTFGKELYCNILSARLANGATTAGAMERWLSSDFGILTITDIGETSSVFRETISSLNMIIIIMLVAAGALAFIVVYNLTNINISERVREIATLKVLGYKHSETNMYIFKENVIMGIIGIIFGGVIGYFLANYMVKTVEVDVVMFYRHIDWTSFLYAAILTLGFILLVNLVMTRKLRKISMVESLKAIE